MRRPRLFPSKPVASRRAHRRCARAAAFAAPLAVAWALACAAFAVCPEEPPLQNYTGGGQTICPCFVAGEEAGAVLTAPAGDYPIEILRVGIGWASQLGGAPQQLEQAIHIYAGGLPNPGTPIFDLPGPQMTDGFLNEFNLEPIAGEIVVSSGPFTVTLEFMNDNAGDLFAPTVVHDGNGCQSGKNVIFAVPGGWLNACSAGISGDWLFYAVYRPVNCLTSVGEEVVASSSSLLLGAQPNPFADATRIEFVLAERAATRLAVYDASGRIVTTLVTGTRGAGPQTATWDGADASGRRVAAGAYFLRLDAGARGDTKRVTVVR
jgi:hypothetical protein